VISKREVRQIAGFDVVLVPTRAATTTVRVVVNAGSAYESARTFGCAHFLEHLFFKGSRHRGYEVINREIAALGEANAYTDCDRTVFHIDTLGPDAPRALEILCELLFEPMLDPAEFERERGAILEEWQSRRDSPWSAFYDAAAAAVLTAPFDVPVIGTRDRIEDLRVTDLHAFRDTHYTRGNIAFVLAGDLAHVDIDMLERVLASVSVPNGPTNLLPPGGLRAQPPDIILQTTHPAEQAIVSLWMPVPTDAQDRAQAYATSILFNALGGGAHSILYDRIREKAGIAYSVGAHEMHYDSLAAGVVIAATSPENAGRCLDIMRGTLAELADNLMDEDLERVARTNCLFGLATLDNTPSGLASCFLDRHFRTRRELDTSARGYLEARSVFHGPRKDAVREVAREVVRAALPRMVAFIQNGDRL